MKTRIVKALILSLFFMTTCHAGWWSKTAHHPNYSELREGDIVFQDTGGRQGRAVEKATGSSYTHCGVVFKSTKANGALYVLEAMQPVKVTSLADWKKRSKVFHARRLKDSSKLNATALKKALAWGEKQIGKDYDLKFRWDDKTLYCSELVWKIYEKSTGLKLCKPKSFQSYYLSDPVVRSVIKQRYGSVDNLPMKEPVVAPSDLAASPLLKEVPLRSKKKAGKRGR